MPEIYSCIEKHLRDSAAVKLSLIKQQEKISSIAAALIEASRNGGRIYTCGNGGSMCDSIHFTEELVARFLRERPGIAAQHLGDIGTITAWANDYSYEQVFERQIQALVTAKDALVCFTTSGKSPNILRALAAANKIGAVTIALLGRGGGPAKALARHALIVESDDTARIQEGHITIVHILCDIIEQTLFPTASDA